MKLTTIRGRTCNLNKKLNY